MGKNIRSTRCLFMGKIIRSTIDFLYVKGNRFSAHKLPMIRPPSGTYYLTYNVTLRQLDSGCLGCCRKNKLKLNAAKIRWKKNEVQYIGHTITSRGLKLGDGKVSAIQQMPEPKDKTGVPRFLGMIQYLEKCLPKLADRTHKLRKLTEKKISWQWGPEEQSEFKDLKQLLTSTEILKYYDVNKNIVIQCDASKDGLGATLMQEGRPIAYASKSLNETQQRYAVIEKELLAVVFACKKFDFYIYGKSKVKVESDHKPLETLYSRPINEITIRLQRMLMSLQRYDLDIQYKPGKEMYIADTLSRAPEDNADNNTLKYCNYASTLAVSPNRLKRIHISTENDNTSRVLKELTISGWPDRSKIPIEVLEYYLIRSSITTNEKLIYKEDKLIVLKDLRVEMINLVHANHGGIGACLRRLREVIYWP